LNQIESFLHLVDQLKSNQIKTNSIQQINSPARKYAATKAVGTDGE
jgi:hypothetical protein